MPFLDSSITHLAKVWRANARAAIIREMEFRVNFFSGIFRQLLWLSTFILFVHVIFQNTETLAGWSEGQVLTLLALSRIIEGISDTLFNRNIIDFPSTVQNGKFDFYLTKPIPAQFHTAFYRFKFLDLGNVIIGIALLIYAISLSDTAFTLINWFQFILLGFLGLTIYYSIMISIASIVFFLEKLDAFQAISSLISEPFTVPFDIFPSGARTVITYLIPLAFVVFVPAQALTGRLSTNQIPIAAVVTIVFLTIANLIWSTGLSRYSSASS